MSLFQEHDSPDDADRGAQGPRGRRFAHQVLMRVFVALRKEGREGAGARTAHEDDARARALTDRILSDFPGHVLPLGLTALVLVFVVCTLPHLRDALPATGVLAASRPVTSIVESGLQQRTSAMSDGLDALRAIVAPFSAEACGSADMPCGSRDCCREAPADREACAPFVKS